MRFTAKMRGCLNVKFHPRLRDGSDLRSRDHQIFSINSISSKGMQASRARESSAIDHIKVFNNVGKRRDGKQGQVPEKKGLKIVLFLKPFYLLVAFEFHYYSLNNRFESTNISSSATQFFLFPLLRAIPSAVQFYLLLLLPSKKQNKIDLNFNIVVLVFFSVLANKSTKD